MADKKITDKQADKALEILSKYCDQHAKYCCEDCQYNSLYGNNRCEIADKFQNR